MMQHREQQQTQKLPLQESTHPAQMEQQARQLWMARTRSVPVVATAVPSSSSRRVGGRAQIVGVGILLTLSPTSSALRWG
jgi:hypothetical protein